MVEKIPKEEQTKEAETDDEVIEPIENTMDDAQKEEKVPKAKIADTDNDDDIVLLSEDVDIEPLEPEEEPIKSIEEEAAHGRLPTILKRGHDHVESSPVEEEIEEIPNKKLKTDDSDSNISSGTLHIDLDGKDDVGEATPAEPIKILDVEEPKMELDKEPEAKSDDKPLGQDTLALFRKGFDAMNRIDLEKLVLQKVPEAMQVKREFAGIRKELHKCHSTLAFYYQKVAEVSKQMLDLDTVHKRVLKDLESTISHVTAPEKKVTRTCGLQVGIPFKVMKPTVSVHDQPHAAGTMLAPPSGTPPKVKASTSAKPSPSPGSYVKEPKEIIDLTIDDDAEEVAAAAPQAISKGSALLRQVANNAGKLSVQPEDVSMASSGGRGAWNVMRASLMPLARFRQRQNNEGGQLSFVDFQEDQLNSSSSDFESDFSDYSSSTSNSDSSTSDSDSSSSSSASPALN